MPRKIMLLLFVVGLVFSCSTEPPEQKAAQMFLDAYTEEFQKLYYVSAKAEWKSNTYIKEGDTLTSKATREANEALAAFTGNVENIEKAQGHLQNKDNLTDLQVRQLNAILYEAADNPQTVPELVKERIKVETEQVEKLYGYDFKIDGKPVTTNEIDDILKNETSLKKRLAAWRASKEVGKELKGGLEHLQRLRNQTVQALDYTDFFAYQVSDYGMTVAEMRALNKRLFDEILPLYRELHTYARYELAEKYGAGVVPEFLPAHWLPNRWGQDWNEMITVEGFDLDGALQEKSAEWLVKQAERFYTSMGLPGLPMSFYEKSSLYPLPDTVDYKKNNHASAWHLDLEHDIRSLMSVEPNARWYETTHHELGHLYYYMAYTNPKVPPLLRGGANRAFHEGVGSLLGLAAMQKPFIQQIGLMPEDAQTDEMQSLLKEALNYIVFMPWSAGVMTEFEYELYSNNLPKDQYNAKWWELKKTYQGIVPPESRGQEYCDAASKTHINNDAAQYYDYALSYVILFQLHDHIAGEILQQDPRATNYYGNVDVGMFLWDILEPGASVDWRQLMQEELGSEISAKPMLTYFEPLMDYLQEKNKGRKHTL